MSLAFLHSTEGLLGLLLVYIGFVVLFCLCIKYFARLSAAKLSLTYFVIAVTCCTISLASNSSSFIAGIVLLLGAILATPWNTLASALAEREPSEFGFEVASLLGGMANAVILYFIVSLLRRRKKNKDDTPS
jgi:hypothetical protein